MIVLLSQIEVSPFILHFSSIVLLSQIEALYSIQDHSLIVLLSQIVTWCHKSTFSSIVLWFQIEALIHILHHSLTVLWSQIVTWDFNLTPSSITTPSPISHPSGISTEGWILAVGWTFAVGWILLVIGFSPSKVSIMAPEVASFAHSIFSRTSRSLGDSEAVFHRSAIISLAIFIIHIIKNNALNIHIWKKLSRCNCITMIVLILSCFWGEFPYNLSQIYLFFVAYELFDFPLYWRKYDTQKRGHLSSFCDLKIVLWLKLICPQKILLCQIVALIFNQKSQK